MGLSKRELQRYSDEIFKVVQTVITDPDFEDNVFRNYIFRQQNTHDILVTFIADDLINSGIAGWGVINVPQDYATDDSFIKDLLNNTSLIRDVDAFLDSLENYIRVGDEIQIIHLDDTRLSAFEGKVGKVTRATTDNMGACELNGTWGGVFVYPDYDEICKISQYREVELDLDESVNNSFEDNNSILKKNDEIMSYLYECCWELFEDDDNIDWGDDIIEYQNLQFYVMDGFGDKTSDDNGQYIGCLGVDINSDKNDPNYVLDKLGNFIREQDYGFKIEDGRGVTDYLVFVFYGEHYDTVELDLDESLAHNGNYEWDKFVNKFSTLDDMWDNLTKQVVNNEPSYNIDACDCLAKDIYNMELKYFSFGNIRSKVQFNPPDEFLDVLPNFYVCTPTTLHMLSDSLGTDIKYSVKNSDTLLVFSIIYSEPTDYPQIKEFNNFLKQDIKTYLDDREFGYNIYYYNNDKNFWVVEIYPLRYYETQLDLDEGYYYDKYRYV